MNNPGPISPSSLPKKKSRLARFEKRIGYINALLLKIGLWVLILLSLGLLWREYHRSYFLIRPIEVPAALVEAGYSPTVVSQRIFDELQSLINRTISVRDFQGFSADQQTAAVDFQVAGFGLSVQSLATQLRMAMGKTERIITGEIVDEGEQLSLRLRVPGKRINDLKVPYASISTALDSLAKEAALKVFEFTEPYLYAVYLHAQKNFDEAIGAANNLIEDKDERKWGLNLIGNIEQDKKNFEKSISYYRRAAAEDEEFVLPIQNLANLYVQLDSSDQAVSMLEKLISMKSESDAIWNLPTYYFALLKSHNSDPQKIKVAKDKLIEASQSEPNVLIICANRASNFGDYKETIYWAEKMVEEEPSNLGALIQLCISNCALGDRASCAEKTKLLQFYYPYNSIDLIGELMISLMDKEYKTFDYLLDSVQVHHPELMANSEGMKIFLIKQNILQEDFPTARKQMAEFVHDPTFKISFFKELFFARDLLPILPDSLSQELEEILP